MTLNDFALNPYFLTEESMIDSWVSTVRSPRKARSLGLHITVANLVDEQCWSRWWFPTFFNVHPYLGKIPILTNIFQLGWNHQLVTHPIQRIILYICINTWFDKFHKKTQLRILGLDPFLFASDENYKYVLLQISWPKKNTKKPRGFWDLTQKPRNMIPACWNLTMKR